MPKNANDTTVVETVVEFEPVDLSTLDAMSDADIEATALADPDNPPHTDDDLERMTQIYEPAQIRAIRERSGESRTAFAAKYGLNHRMLEHWENSTKSPSLAVHILLRIIDREPAAVERALAAAE